MNIVAAELVASAAELAQCPAERFPEVALAGRSNVGKSSLLNCLANRKNLARTSKTPGRTRTINFYLINRRFYLVDLPGYGYAQVSREERERWGPLIEGYLAQRGTLAGVVQIVDIRHPPTDMDRQLYQWLQHYRLRAAVVATKADKISRSQVARSLQLIREAMGLESGVPLVAFSAVTREGRAALLKIIAGWIG